MAYTKGKLMTKYWKSGKENKAQGKSLEDEELRQKLIIHPASIQWAKYHWEGKLEAIYLREAIANQTVVE